MSTGRSEGRSGEAGSVKPMVRAERERRSSRRNKALVSGDILGNWRGIQRLFAVTIQKLATLYGNPCVTSGHGSQGLKKQLS